MFRTDHAFTRTHTVEWQDPAQVCGYVEGWTSLAPRPASSRALAAPIPLLAPVMTMTLSWITVSSGSLPTTRALPR